MTYLLECVGKHYVVRRHRLHALQSVSLSVEKGERVAVLGSSGAGKTTLFRLLNTTLLPTSGSIHLDGQELVTMSGAELRCTRRRIGTIYQQHNLVPSLSVLENTLCGCLGRWSLAETLRSLFHPKAADVRAAMHCLELVGLADKRHARADELSGGQQQRLAIARVLMQNPDVILADEPVASLDPTLSDEIMSQLIELGSQGERTLIVAMHKVELALRHFPRVVGLKEGTVFFDRAPSTVHENLLQDLYANHRRDSRQAQDESRFQRGFGCAR
jgi:phosphonate transport system ATP-binding protein